MNQELEHALVDFVNQLTSLVEAGTQQLPAVLNDIIAYRLFQGYFELGLGTAFIVLGWTWADGAGVTF